MSIFTFPLLAHPVLPISCHCRAPFTVSPCGPPEGLHNVTQLAPLWPTVIDTPHRPRVGAVASLHNPKAPLTLRPLRPPTNLSRPSRRPLNATPPCSLMRPISATHTIIVFQLPLVDMRHREAPRFPPVGRRLHHLHEHATRTTPTPVIIIITTTTGAACEETRL